MITHSSPATHKGTLQFAAALSRNADTEAATRDVADAVRRQIGQHSVDLAFMFFSAHHAAHVTVISTMLQEALKAEICVGCSGEGVIGGSEELETAPALAHGRGCERLRARPRALDRPFASGSCDSAPAVLFRFARSDPDNRLA